MRFLNRLLLIPKLMRGVKRRWGMKGVIVFVILIVVMVLFGIVKASQAFLPFTYIAV